MDASSYATDRTNTPIHGGSSTDNVPETVISPPTEGNRQGRPRDGPKHRTRRNKNPPRESQWDKHRPIIKRLYVDEEKCLEEVVSIMKKDYDFHPSEQAYKKIFPKWGLVKNIPRPIMAWMATKLDERNARGVDTTFHWHDRPVDTKKVERFKKKHLNSQEQASMAVHSATPPNLRCFTPPPATTADVADSRIGVDDITGPTPTPAFLEGQYDQEDMAQRFPFGDLSADLVPPPDQTYNVLPGSQIHSEIGLVEAESLFDTQTYWADDGFQSLEAKLRRKRFESVNNALINGFSQEKDGQDNDAMANDAIPQYKKVLADANGSSDAPAILNALRGIVRIHGDYDELEEVIPELERLVGGCLFLYGGDSYVYLQQSLKLATIYISIGKSKDHPNLLRTLVHGFAKSEVALDEQSCMDLIYVARNYLALPDADYATTRRIFTGVLQQLAIESGPLKEASTRLTIVGILQDEGLLTAAVHHLSQVLDYCCDPKLRGHDLFVGPDEPRESILGRFFDSLERQFISLVPAEVTLLGDRLWKLRCALLELHDPSRFHAVELRYWIRLAKIYSKLQQWQEVYPMLNLPQKDGSFPWIPYASAQDLRDIYWELRQLAESCWQAQHWESTLFVLEKSAYVARYWWGENAQEFKLAQAAMTMAQKHTFPPRFYPGYPGVPRLSLSPDPTFATDTLFEPDAVGL